MQDYLSIVFVGQRNVYSNKQKTVCSDAAFA